MSLKFIVILALSSCLLHSHFTLAEETTTKASTTTSTSTSTSTTTSTEKPSTTTPTSPTTTKAPSVPAKKFPENIGKWNVSSTALNRTCILFTAAIQLSLNYTEQPNKTAIARVDIPDNAAATGNCSDTEQTLVLSWSNSDNLTNQVTFFFTEIKDNKTGENYSVKDIAVNVFQDEMNFPNATKPKGLLSVSLGKVAFTTPVNHTYTCKAEIELKKVNSTMLSVKFESAQIEAFKTTPSNETVFSKEYICTEDISDIVPVAIGGILAVIFILLAAAAIGGVVFYVFKKKRAQSGTGYQNM